MYKENHKLFTIAIPTYNRSELLRKCLDSLCYQVESYSDLVEVYISDNCSNDNTKEIVDSYILKYPKIIRYYKQSTNIGPDANFVDCVHHIDSKYFALLSDDDIVTPFYVKTIVELLNDSTLYGALYFNAIIFNDNHKYIGVRDNIQIEKHIKRYDNGYDFLYAHMSTPSLISTTICNTNSFIQEAKNIDITDYPGYGWYAVICYSILKMPCLYYDLPLIITRCPQQQRWEKDAVLYQIGGLAKLFNELDIFVPGISKKWKDILYSQKIKTIFSRILLNNKAYYTPLYKKLIDQIDSNDYKIFLYIYIHNTPSNARLLYSFYRKINSVVNINDYVIKYINKRNRKRIAI